MQPPHGVVVVIDDDAPMRKSIERLLRASGYATGAFESAEEFLQSGLIDSAIALLVDVRLDGLSGIDLYRSLSSTHAQVPVVFMTARDHAPTREDAMSLGCVAFLQKPFEAAALLRALRLCEKTHQRNGPDVPG